MNNHQKNKFYRNLKLDDESKKILKWFREVQQKLINDEIKEKDLEDE